MQSPNCYEKSLWCWQTPLLSLEQLLLGRRLTTLTKPKTNVSHPLLQKIRGNHVWERWDQPTKSVAATEHGITRTKSQQFLAESGINTRPSWCSESNVVDFFFQGVVDFSAEMAESAVPQDVPTTVGTTLGCATRDRGWGFLSEWKTLIRFQFHWQLLEVLLVFVLKSLCIAKYLLLVSIQTLFHPVGSRKN